MGRVKDANLFGLGHDYFMVYLPKQCGYSPHTIRGYRTAIDGLLDFAMAKKNCQLTDITFDMLDRNMLSGYLDGVEESGCEVSTRNQRLNAIRAFYGYAAKISPLAVIHKAEIYKVPVKKPTEAEIVEYMSEAAVKALPEQPNVLTKIGLRDSFIMLMMYDTASRVQGIADIELRHITFGKHPKALIHGKGDKYYPVPIMKQTAEHCKNYLKVYHPGESVYSSAPLFYTMSRDGTKKPLDTGTIRKRLVYHGNAARKRCPALIFRLTFTPICFVTVELCTSISTEWI